MQARIIDNVSSLRDLASSWDDLYNRSAAACPLLAAEHVAQWVEQFAPGRRFAALVVEQDGALAAALPLVGTTVGKVIQAGGITSNPWAPCGELLLDETQDTQPVINALLDGAARLPWQLLWINDVAYRLPRWQAFLAGLQQRQEIVETHPRFEVVHINTTGSWEDARAAWSKGHRRRIKRALKAAESTGELSLSIKTQFEPDEVSPWLKRGFEVEDRNWKGRNGTSILKTEGMPEYFQKQAEELAANGQLQISFLELDGEPMSFEYGWNAKGVYHSFKVGYDENFKSHSPGMLLLHEIIRESHEGETTHTIDCLGPATDATSHWATSNYTIGRIVAAPGRACGRAFVYGYKYIWGKVREMRQGKAKQAGSLASHP